MNTGEDLTINKSTYQWCVRAFALLEKRLGLNIRIHGMGDEADQGQIFLFNHFARFETVIPQYLLFREFGHYCRTLATHELFAGNVRFANFLRRIGVVPNDLEGLLPFLAAEILRGRKVVVFPEGGMIKDHRVVDPKGEYGIYSPTAMAHRKHHKGAATIAVMLEIFKKRILSVHAAGETARLKRWVEALGLPDEEALLAAARKPTLIVPANITFYPLRAGENILDRAARHFAKDLREEFKEELRIEGNFLLKETDMDIRFGPALNADIAWHWWERRLLDKGFAHVDSLEKLFDQDAHAEKWMGRLTSGLAKRNMQRLRDRCTKEMYGHVTANLAHLTSRLMLRLLERGVTQIGHAAFHKMLYLAIKHTQMEPSIHLHEGLADPEAYEGLLDGSCKALDELLAVAAGAGLLVREPETYRFLPKLSEGHAFHKVRVENPVQVCANEIAPLTEACKAVDQSIDLSSRIDAGDFAALLFDDELRRYSRCKNKFAAGRYLEINRRETATESGQPYLFLPEKPKPLAVVLVHGFLASPAELRGFGERLHDEGYPVIGLRLNGHGTSPWDLHERNWQSWMASVRNGFEIASAFAERTCIVGFSAGGTLALRFAADDPAGLAAVASVSAPIKLRNKNAMFAPVIHGANKVAAWTSSSSGVMPFRFGESEHPAINYRHMPVSGLVELRRVIDDLKKNLGKVTAPVAILQGKQDPIVDPSSAEVIFEKIASQKKWLHWVESERHGILHEDIDGTCERLMDFLASLTRGEGVATQEDKVPASEADLAARLRRAF